MACASCVTHGAAALAYAWHAPHAWHMVQLRLHVRGMHVK